MEGTVKFKRIYSSAKEPVKKSAMAAGWDLFSNIETVIHPGCTAVILTDIAVELPPNVYGRIEGKSSLAFHHEVVPYPGLIDQDFRYYKRFSSYLFSINT